MQEQEQRESLGILIGKVDVQFLPFAISIGDIQLVPPGGPGLLGGSEDKFLQGFWPAEREGNAMARSGGDGRAPGFSRS